MITQVQMFTLPWNVLALEVISLMTDIPLTDPASLYAHTEDRVHFLVHFDQFLKQTISN